MDNPDWLAEEEKYLNRKERKECLCTNPHHGGKLWLCDTQECYLNRENNTNSHP